MPKNPATLTGDTYGIVINCECRWVFRHTVRLLLTTCQQTNSPTLIQKQMPTTGLPVPNFWIFFCIQQPYYNKAHILYATLWHRYSSTLYDVSIFMCWQVVQYSNITEKYKTT